VVVAAVPVVDTIPLVAAHTTVVAVVEVVVVAAEELARTTRGDFVAVAGSVLVLSTRQFGLVIVLISEHALVVPCTVLPVPSVTPTATPPTDDHHTVAVFWRLAIPVRRVTMQKQQQRTVARPTVVVAVAAAGCGLVVAAVMVVIPNHHCPPSVGAVAPAHSLPRVR